MDLTVFQYITTIPDVINNEIWFELAVRAYNLGLTAVWLILLIWILDVVFTCFSKLYKRGHE